MPDVCLESFYGKRKQFYGRPATVACWLTHKSWGPRGGSSCLKDYQTRVSGSLRLGHPLKSATPRSAAPDEGEKGDAQL